VLRINPPLEARELPVDLGDPDTPATSAGMETRLLNRRERIVDSAWWCARSRSCVSHNSLSTACAAWMALSWATSAATAAAT
jgi:hypothetical protein